jgi:hypothetical protein
MLIRYLIDGSILHHDRLLIKLKQWEGISAAHLKEDVGRIEVSAGQMIVVQPVIDYVGSLSFFATTKLKCYTSLFQGQLSTALIILLCNRCKGYVA